MSIKFTNRNRRGNYISYYISYTGLGALPAPSVPFGLHLLSHSTGRPIEANRKARARRLSSPHSPGQFMIEAGDLVKGKPQVTDSCKISFKNSYFNLPVNHCVGFFFVFCKGETHQIDLYFLVVQGDIK